MQPKNVGEIQTSIITRKLSSYPYTSHLKPALLMETQIVSFLRTEYSEVNSFIST